MNVPITDIHVHPFRTENENCSWYPGAVSTPEEFKRDLLRAGITVFCGSVIERISGKNFEEIQALNRSALKLREMYQNCYFPGIHIHPAFFKESCLELEVMSRLGVKLVGELVPYMMGYQSYTSKKALEIFRLAGELGMTVSIHPTEDADIEKLLKNCPHTNFILAHPGELAHYETQLEWLRNYDNAYYDLSATGVFRYGMLRYGIDRAGKEKFLFGSDYPICNPKSQVEGVLYERLSLNEYEAIFQENANRLLFS